MKCMIIDDEHLARKLLTAYVEKIPDLELVAICEGPLQALEAIPIHQPDLILLDIQMPNLSGLELLKSLPNRPQVIFTTAYASHAVEGFELDVTDYLLKPIALDRFAQAINKARERHQVKTSNVPAPTASHFFVKADYKLVKVRYDEILYIEGLREYVSIYTEKRRLIVYQTLKNLEKLLPSDEFIRAHKSYIVPLSRIDSLYGNKLEIHSREIPIGKSYKEALMARIAQL